MQSGFSYDIRIIDIGKESRMRRTYLEFVQERILQEQAGERNEFEPSPISLDELEKQQGVCFQSAMVLFFPYLGEENSAAREHNISLHAQSGDYHTVCKKMMAHIMQKNNLSPEECYYQCDNGAMNERIFAIQSGLCARGTNGMAIHSDFGSYGFLGLILTSTQLPENITSPEHCCGCGRCIDACPNQALDGSGVRSGSCLSYLTQKKSLNVKEEHVLRNHDLIYGCDTCQRVCAENEGIKYTKTADFRSDLMYNIRLEELCALSNRTFRLKYRDRTFAWRGKNTLIRNLNLIGIKKYEPTHTSD